MMQIEIRDICMFIYIFGTSIASRHAPIVMCICSTFDPTNECP